MNMSEILEVCQADKADHWLYREGWSTLSWLSQWTMPPDTPDDDLTTRETSVPVRLNKQAIYMPHPELSVVWGLHLETWVYAERKTAPTWAGPEPLPFRLPFTEGGAAVLLNGVPIWETNTAEVRIENHSRVILARPQEYFLAKGQRPFTTTWEVGFAQLLNVLDYNEHHDQVWTQLVARDTFDVIDTDPIRSHGRRL